MDTKLINKSNQTFSMTSIDLAKIINKVRKEEQSDKFKELTHDNFMKKIVKVLGDLAHSFKCTRIDERGKVQPCYNLFKRETPFISNE